MHFIHVLPVAQKINPLHTLQCILCTKCTLFADQLINARTIYVYFLTDRACYIKTMGIMFCSTMYLLVKKI